MLVRLGPVYPAACLMGTVVLLALSVCIFVALAAFLIASFDSTLRDFMRNL